MRREQSAVSFDSPLLNAILLHSSTGAFVAAMQASIGKVLTSFLVVSQDP
ncbi:MAG: hypothetical protein ACYC6G_17715 [Desulfobaccales bacterium]